MKVNKVLLSRIHKILASSVMLSFFTLSFLLTSSQVFAGTDLQVTCANASACAISPANTPLFAEQSWFPGSQVSQFARISNTTSQSGFSAIEVVNYRNELKNLGEVLSIEIRKDSPTGAVLYGPTTLHQFRDDGYFTFDALAANTASEYYLVVTMPQSAGNQYQAGQVLFDLNFGLELTPLPAPSTPPTLPSTPSVLGATSPASPPVCTAQTPTSAPVLSITSTGANTVSLDWTATTPVTHYALVFTRDSDGAEYGSPNIGNVTSYTITNLSANQSYSFQVLGVNDCAPGERSSVVSSGTIAGLVLAPDVRPIGEDEQVLGVVDDEQERDLAQPAGLSAPEILGAATCEATGQYLPWLILVAQALLLLVLYWILREDAGKKKQLFAALITLTSIALFYFFRQCDCYEVQSILAILCKWYWVVALATWLLTLIFNYAFFEETN